MCRYKELKGMYYCRKCFQERKLNMEDWEIDKISDKVFLGNEEGGMNIDKLKEFGISHILICGLDLEKFYPDDFMYKHILIDDHTSEDIKKYFRECLNFIESAKKVYVHCWAGVSRSATVVIAYFMWKLKLNYEDAREFVEGKREGISPNEGFIKQLKEFEFFLNENNYKLSKKGNFKK